MHTFTRLTFTTLLANPGDDRLSVLLLSPENRIWHFMQTVSNGFDFSYKSSPYDLTFHANCLHYRQFAWNVISWFLGENKKNISVCLLLKSLPRVLSVKQLIYMVNKVFVSISNKIIITLVQKQKMHTWVSAVDIDDKQGIYQFAADPPSHEK